MGCDAFPSPTRIHCPTSTVILSLLANVCVCDFIMYTAESCCPLALSELCEHRGINRLGQCSSTCTHGKHFSYPDFRSPLPMGWQLCWLVSARSLITRKFCLYEPKWTMFPVCDSQRTTFLAWCPTELRPEYIRIKCTSHCLH